VLLIILESFRAMDDTDITDVMVVDHRIGNVRRIVQTRKLSYRQKVWISSIKSYKMNLLILLYTIPGTGIFSNYDNRVNSHKSNNTSNFMERFAH